MRALSLTWVAVAGSALVTMLAVVDDPVLWRAGLFALAGTAVVVVAVAPMLLRRREPLIWRLLACGLALFALSEALRLGRAMAGGVIVFPGPPDLSRLAGMAVVAVALGAIVRVRTLGRDWDSIIDSAIVTVGLACLVWSGLAGRIEASPPALTQLSVVAYPLLGLVLVAFSVRLTTTVGIRDSAASLLLAGAGLLLLWGCLYVSGRIDGTYVPGGVVDVLVVSALVVLSSAALDPSMSTLTVRAVEPDAVSARERMAVVVVGVGATAGSLWWGLNAGSVDPFVAVGVVVVLGLVVARVATGLRVFEAALRREAVLQAGAAALVSARTHAEARTAATATALELGGGPLRSYVSLEFDSLPDLAIENAVVVGGSDEHAIALRGAIRLEGTLGRLGTARTFVAPIIVHGRMRGVLRVTGTRPLPRDLYEALGTLGAQISLALESIERGEEVLERRSEARFRSLVQSSKDLIAVLEPDSTIRYVTPSSREMLGRDPAGLVGTRFDLLLDPEDAEQIAVLVRDPVEHAPVVDREVRLQRADGGSRTVALVLNDLRRDPDVAGIVVTAHDVTEQRELEIQLTHQAFHDALTDLPNRALLSDRIEHAIRRARRSGEDVALLFLDIDDFKTVNDSLGHAAGDELLGEVATRLRGCVRETDTPARLGGDEFAVLVEAPEGIRGPMVVAQRILDEVARPLTIGQTEVHLRASIGIVFGKPEKSVGEMLRSADIAMYQAKRDGGGRFEVFEPQMHEVARNRLELKADLETAFRAEQLDLHYQPLVDLASGQPVGFEALLRWTHPTRGNVPPGEFVPLAEETGLINEIGEWVLRRACHQTRAWQISIPGCERISANVNLAARQILQPAFVETVTSVLAQSGLAARDLVLEITEGTMLVDVEGVAERLGELRSHGVRIAIDDFGTGFSSLAYLQRFPLDELKIAREFVDGVVTDGRRNRLVEAIVTLAKLLDLETVAEGIEVPAQRDRLHALGCTVGQGYLFSRPLPAAEVPSLLRQALVHAA